MIGLFQPEVGRRLSGHPITDKLVMAVNFAKMDIDIDGAVALLIPEDTGVAGPGAFNPNLVVYVRGTNHYGTWAGFGGAALNSNFTWTRSDFVPTSGGCTVLMLYEKADSTNRASITWGVNTSTVASYCHAAVPYSDGIVYFAFGGNTAGVTRLDVAGLTFGADRWVFSTGARGMECWQNGLLRGSNGVNPTRTGTPTTGFALGSKTAPVIFSDIAHYNLFAMWQRQLTRDEILMVSADPYMLWESPSDLSVEAFLAATAGSVSAGGAHPVGIITQLTPMGIPGQRYGTFAGKAAVVGGAHPVGRITQLMPIGIPGRRYGSFAGKAGAVQIVLGKRNALLGVGKIG